MQRFVTYIYAYDNGQKAGNAGYAKIETRGQEGRIEMHLLGTEVVKGDAEVYFLRSREKQLEYYKAGEFVIEEGTGTFQMRFQMTDVALSGLEFEQMDGIGIKDSHERGYLSFWKDIKQTVFKAEIFVPGGNEARDEMAEQKQEADEGMTLVEETTPLVENVDSIEEREQEILHTMEIPVRNIFPKVNLVEIWQMMQKNRLSVQINEEVSAIRIELKDLRELPKQYWYLGNNSFLLHGFFNYRYLLLGKLPDERWFLGVPGVYQKQERVMAAIFGFPGFLAAGEMRGQRPMADGEKEEKNWTATEDIRELQPGAWYHILED